MDRVILHIDMNSYFASVEQQANPFLRGKAVGVCSYLSPGGCIIASSMEAKAKGIKTGCRVKEALNLDPRVVLLENEPAKYRSTTEKIFKILSSYTDALEPYSIDEAFLDLTHQPYTVGRQAGWVKDFKEAEIIGKEIQARIKREVGEWLSSSIGISFTKFLAKFASDIAPKKTILVITKDNLEKILEGCDLKDAWGINSRMEERLKHLGINNLLELKNYSSAKIKRVLGLYGYYLWANVNGLEISTVNSGVPLPKSVGHSYCLPKKTMDKKYLGRVYYKLCEKTGRRLRSLNLEAHEARIGLAYVRDGGLFKSFKTREKMFTTEDIYKQVDDFLARTDILAPVSMLAVSVARLTPVVDQMSLFSDNLKVKRLSQAMDMINDKYGEYTLVRGEMFKTEDLARDRIGFRKSVEV